MKTTFNKAETGPNKIRCPKCGAEIDVNEVLFHDLSEKIAQDVESKLAVERGALAEKEKELVQGRQTLLQQQKDLADQVETQVKDLLREREGVLRKSLAIEAEETHSDQLKVLHEELNQKSEKLKELNKTKAEIERLKREKDELKESLEADNEKKFNELLAQSREQIQRTEQERSALAMKEKEKKIEDLRQQLVDAQRKLEQGSQQLQGEVQELAIEQWLRNEFPLDTIEEIKKGTPGGDCIQTVNTREHADCGAIYYESKRTKSFQPSWIEKFKSDIREKSATIGVIVTEAMPSNMERMGLKDGIWVCGFEEFKGLALALRESIIRVSEATSGLENRGTKMEMLYAYLTGSEFRMQVEAIVEGFTQMQKDLDSEKRAMEGIWSKRQKQIEKVLLSTTRMYGSVKGIAGSSVQDVIGLEFDGQPGAAQ